MDFEAVAFAVVAVWAWLAAVILVFYHEFEDKLLGRVGLVLIIVGYSGVIHDIWQDGPFAVLRTTLIATLGVAFFLTRMCTAHFSWWRRKNNSVGRRVDDHMRLF